MDMETNNSQMPSSQNSPPAPTQNPFFDLKKGDFIFFACAVIVSIFTAVCGIFGGFSLGYFLSCMLMASLFTLYFAKGMKVRFFPVLCGILSLANATVFFCTSNGSVRFFSAVVSFLLGLLCFGEFVNGPTKGNRETMGVFYAAGSAINNIEISVKSLFVSGNGKQRAIGKVLVGLLCAVPALLVIIPLLLASDDAFLGMMSKLFSNSLANIMKIVFGLFLSVFVVSYGFSFKKGRLLTMKKSQMTGVENVYIISFLSAISVCYLMYLFSQLAYFFSAFRGFLPDGQITYAEYARKGFFEMCAIASINLGLVFLSLLLAKKKKGTVCNAIKLLATFIAVFTLIVIATAISKMALYIDAYGMTVLRLTTSAFMVFLAVVFLSAILRIFVVKINIVKTALICSGCILLLLGIINVNAVCARYNYDSFMSGKLSSVDVEAMYQLGDEGIPYLVKLADHEDGSVSAKAKEYLALAIMYDYFEDLESDTTLTVELLRGKEYNNSFSHFSIPKAAAYNSLYAFLAEHTDFASYYTFLKEQMYG